MTCLIAALALSWASPADAFAVRVAHAVADAPGVTTTQHGSGTVVKVEAGRYWVLTCRHVVEHRGRVGAGEVSVTTHAGARRAARVVAHDRDRDLAVLEVASPPPPGVAAARVAAAEEYRPGLEVYKVGYPGGGPRVVASGAARDYESRHPRNRDVVSLVATARSASGDSGGGVFRGSDGALVGVVWGGLPDGLRATRVKDVWLVLRRAGLEVEPAR